MLPLEDKTKKKIYGALNYGFIDKTLIKPVYYAHGKCYSRNSYLLTEENIINAPDGTPKNAVLKRVFGITLSDVFDKAYNQAVSGSGQEGRRISVMHSSSLCALLCFYKVSDEYPVTINKIRYNRVCFEVQNEVFENPCNMDVVLVSDKDKSILFLESKFSEYLSHGKASDISPKYAKVYDELNLTELGYQYPVTKGQMCLEKGRGKNNFYIGGIKQMISHYIGVKSFCESKQALNNHDVVLKDGYSVYLGEILFNAWGDDAITGYKVAYKALAEKMNCINDMPFTILGDVLTYQDVFKDYPLDENVKDYYNLKQ